ncbi:coenzyme A transporter [Tieghemiomyces parasiticus]|uniref:Coenzyme A transporter n=1 Tax=Tieghemiomyces parasiticus TaxID=78921 RepID=A0A9W7ZQ29_9FUNG|nr:coenzyme A transporter [Tieghemiomyces parasiticus]
MAGGSQRRPGRQDRDLTYVAKTLFAGGIAGCAAKTVVAPLDRVKILFQANQPQFRRYSGSLLGVARAGRAIVAQQGFTGLFQGHSMSLLRIFPYASIKFMAYEQFRIETDLRHFVAGSLAGTSSVLVTYPLDLIRVRMAYETGTDKSHKTRRAVQRIWGESTYRTKWLRLPITNFYTGFGMSVLGMIPYAGASFYVHAALERLCRERLPAYTTIPSTPAAADAAGTASTPVRRAQLNFWAQLLSGGLAGIVAQTVSYPIEIVRRRMQVAGALDAIAKIQAHTVAREIYAAGGLRGFYVGLSIGYLKVAPMFAVSFYVYEKVKYLLDIE